MKMTRSRVLLLVLFGTVVLAAPAGAQSGSNASNYGSGAQLSVNGRTGDVDMSVTLVRLPGIVSEMGLSLAMSYRSEDARSNIQSNTRHFGLPYGWSLGLSFIYNEGSSIKLNVDGTQVYQLDTNWRTSFIPIGANAPLYARTGLMQYNRADAHLKSDNGSVVVNGLGSAYIFTNLEGQLKYFSPGGLMIREADRFGNYIDYHYLNSVTGGNASNSTTAANATLSALIDTWGNTVTLAPCLDPGSCVANEIRITMPDGRTMGWVAPDAYTITEIIDSEGMVTHLQWQNSTCGDQSYGNRRLANMTTSVGGMTSLTYTCLDVCQTNGCGQKTSWSVVDTEYECPNNQSGVACPAGSPNGDFLTTKYQFKNPGGANSDNNYTGYPRYSPYQPSVAGADALMSASDQSFEYTTITSKHRANGVTIHEVQTDYNFLHLQQEQRVYVSDQSSSTLMLSKETSYCYPISDTATGTMGCPLTTANYQQLPSNYQSPIIQGSCQYNVTGNAVTGGARRSAMTMTYDAFGNTIRKRIFHATSAQGIVGTCDRPTRLRTSDLRLVAEDHMQYDTPTALDNDGYVDIGAGSGHFGLMLGQQSFVYLDEDDSNVGAHGQLQDVSGPVLVKLQCNQLTSATGAEATGTNIKTSTTGLMATTAAAPTTLGVIDACGGSSWIALPAPPKTTTFSYDANGRSYEQLTEWASGFTAPAGVPSTSQTFTYGLSATTSDEEACPGESSVLQITSIDGQGHSTVNRLCTLNGFHLSAADGNGNTTLMTHSANGLTATTTHADGTRVDTQYYYTCPVAQNGSTQTCPSTSTALKDCPYDSQTQKRNCTVKTMSSGPGQSSFVDGVIKVDIRDGLGRMVEALDNLGGSVGSGYTAMQTTKTMTFDDRGMLVKSRTSIGATNPLIYETATTLGPKLRPILVCGPRGETHQFVHDDVMQETKAIFNGTDREAYVTNDSEKLTTIANCGLMANQTTSGSSGCTTVASDMGSAECAGDAYYTYTLHDGSGQEHSVAAMAGQSVDLGASVTGVNGVSTYSADLLKYAYSLTSTNQGDTQITANSSFKRDLQGHVLEQVVTVETTTNGGGASVSSSSTFASDDVEYNNIDQKIRERNKLSDLPGAPVLQETYTYDPVGNLKTMTTYAGTEFQNFYDNRNRLVRHCFPTATGSEGEKMVLDPVTGAIMTVTRFTNPGACGASDARDVEVVTESYTYTRFGAIESITYSDGTTLEWSYDPYQRAACFADALATTNGHHCPDSPIDVGFAPDPSQLLTYYVYWPDSDTYRRGLLQRKCRGVPDGSGGFVTKCMDTDYYTSADVGGSCSAALSSIVGAFASMVKSETYCSGGGCDDGGSLVYRTSYSYDEHRRPCLVESRNAHGDAILSSAYGYDQFDNVVHEEHSSEIDASDDSNYQIDYTYDGLLRVIGETRNDADGDLIKKTTYEYDAASNLTRKTEEEPDVGSEESPTATPATATPTTPVPTPTGPAATATNPAVTPTGPPPSATSQPTAGGGNDDGCQIEGGNGSAWPLVLPIALAALLRRRRRAKRPPGDDAG